MKRYTLALALAFILTVAAHSAFPQEETRSNRHNMPAFSDIDLDNDGSIVAHEFYQARSKRMAERAANGGKMRNAANAPSFEDIDTNSDGKVSPDEFSAHQAERMAKRQGGKQN